MSNQLEIDPIVRTRPAMNPYKHAWFIVRRRLQWDADWRSFVSRKRLCSILNSHKRKKAVIVCNGPTLLQTDLSLLKDTYTFGLNKINLLFDKTDWRPSCIVSINQLVIEQNAEFYNSTDIPLFLDERERKRFQFRKNITFLHCSDQPGFARDCSISINEGYTVTVAALQLAFHMGFADVAIVGCDHNFASKGPANATVSSGSSDASHFDPHYFAGGVKWQLPDLLNSEHYYALALRVYKAHNRRIINCTEGGLLDVFPRLSLSDWLQTSIEA